MVSSVQYVHQCSNATKSCDRKIFMQEYACSVSHTVEHTTYSIVEKQANNLPSLMKNLMSACVGILQLVGQSVREIKTSCTMSGQTLEWSILSARKYFSCPGEEESICIPSHENRAVLNQKKVLLLCFEVG